jgi:hypothetical protein
MSNITELLNGFVQTFSTEYSKFSSGNASAGTRARKALQEITKVARDGRKSIQEEKNSRKNNKA